MSISLRVLIVEDSENDALLIVDELRDGGYDVTFERVETREAMESALGTHEWDIIIADYRLPDFSGIEALEMVCIGSADCPFIIVSGQISEETAVKAMRAGAQDYVLKSNLARLVPAVDRELREAEVRRQRNEAQAALRESEEHLQKQAAELQSFIASMADGIAAWNADGRVVLVNEVGKQILGVPEGVPSEEWSGQYELRTLDDKPLPRGQRLSSRALAGEQTKNVRSRLVTPWRSTIISSSAAPVRDAAGLVIGATAVFRDISEEVELERQRDDMYEREHHIARMLQSALVPPMTVMEVEGCKAALKYEPALREAEVGGDFYDVFKLGEGKVGIVIGDIAGKGLASAVHVAAAKHAIRSYAHLFESPAKVMALANDVLCKGELGEQMYSNMLTAFYAVVDARKGIMVHSRAGHEPPVIMRADGSMEELAAAGGIALGVLCGCEYAESVCGLGPGDTVVMITDGITEARTTGIVLFGKEGVFRYLSENRQVPFQDIPSGLLEAARAHGGGSLQDDAAVVVLTCDVEPTGG